MSQTLPPQERIVEPSELYRMDLHACTQSPNFANVERQKASVHKRLCVWTTLFRVGIGGLVLSGALYLHQYLKDTRQQEAAEFLQAHPELPDEEQWTREVLVRFALFCKRLDEDRAADPQLLPALCDERLEELARMRRDFERSRRELAQILPHVPQELSGPVKLRLMHLDAALDPQQGTLLQLESIYRQMKEE